MTILVRKLGVVEYLSCFEAMRDYVTRRGNALVSDKFEERLGDEFWVVEHPPVYTLGKAGKREHILNAGDIPIVASDRGGQVTYHGPGQMVVYTMLKLRDYELGPRSLVKRIEQGVIDSLAQFDLTATRREGAPGVYLNGEKIASLGLRIKNGISYHGVAVNIDVDLSPFLGINPCGFEGLKVTRLRDHLTESDSDAYRELFITQLINQFSEESELKYAS